MRVLYFVGGVGISETFIYELALGLNAKYDMKVISLSEPFYSEGLDYKVINSDLPYNFSYLLNYSLESRGKKIAYNLKKKLTARKVSSLIKTFDIVYIDYGTNAVLILPLLVKLKIPFIVHFHGFDITSQLNFAPYKKDLALLFEKASFVIAASNHIKRLIILNGCDEKKVKMVRCGISIPTVPKYNYDRKQIDFITIGRLTPKKNPIASILAFKIVLDAKPNVNLHIVGDGPLLKDCQALVQKLSIKDSVTFHGSLMHEKAIELLAQSKIYVQHSVTSSTGDQEGFAISLAEAALFEIPVVSTLHNGIPENVIDGKTGFLVREFDYESMAQKMLLLIEDSLLAKRMGLNGKTHIEKLCDSAKRVDSISKLLERAIIEK